MIEFMVGDSTPRRSAPKADALPDLPRCATIRPLTDKFAGAMAAVQGLTASGLFIGQTNDFFKALQTLAAAADAAVRKW